MLVSIIMPNGVTLVQRETLIKKIDTAEAAADRMAECRLAESNLSFRCDWIQIHDATQLVAPIDKVREMYEGKAIVIPAHLLIRSLITYEDEEEA